MTQVNELVQLAKILILKEEIIKKNSYERCVYESVDDRCISYDISRKLKEKINQVIKD